ncbi:hypothetical protein OV450_1418 [Actinobacteria bacterium OV450]|nr:hypothetical protein OV450_1418 [Actinobacteria bacterium OV450]
MNVRDYLTAVRDRLAAQDTEDDETPEAPTAPVPPPRPDYEPAPAPAPTYNGRPIPRGSSVPPPGQTISLDCQHVRVHPEADRTTGDLVSLTCADCGDDLPLPPRPAPTPPAGPDWWSTKKPAPGPAEPAQEPEEESEEEPAEAPTGDQPAPAAEPTQTEVSKEKDPGAAAGENPLKRVYREWTGRPAFPQPVHAEEAKSLMQRIRESSVDRWGFVYHGAALAVGWKAGLIEWAYDSMLWIDIGSNAWHDTRPICAYVFCGLVLALDRWTGKRFILWSFLGRVPTVSFAVGALLYGGTEVLFS